MTYISLGPYADDTTAYLLDVFPTIPEFPLTKIYKLFRRDLILTSNGE